MMLSCSNLQGSQQSIHQTLEWLKIPIRKPIQNHSMSPPTPFYKVDALAADLQQFSLLITWQRLPAAS